MLADGYLSVFTQMFGWHYYSYIWDILVASGLVFLPFLGILIDHVSAVRSRGSLINNDGESAFSGLEVQLFTALLVILIAAVPNTFTTLSETAIKYSAPDSIYADAKEVNAGATGSTFDAVIDTSTATTADPIAIPPFWYLVIRISQAIKQTMVDSYDSKGQIFRDLRREVSHLMIENPEVRDHVSRFKSECYWPALSAFELDTAARGGATAMVSDSSASKVAGQDIGWMGSSYLQANYYPKIRTRSLTPGFAYDAAINTEYDASTGTGTPLCSEYWPKLRTLIYDEADKQGFVGRWNKAVRLWPDWAPGADDIDVEDQVAMTYLQNTPIPNLANADTTVALKNGEQGAFGKAANWAGGMITAVELGKLALKIEAGLDALIYALQIGQAYFLMVIYMMLGIGLLVSRYSVSYLMQAALLIFMVTFWTALWSLVGWLDGTLAETLYNNQNIILTFKTLDPAEINKRLAHAIAIGFLYLSAPAVAAWVLTAAGSRVGHALTAGPHQAAGATSPTTGGVRAPAAAATGARIVGRAAKQTYLGEKKRT